MDARWKHPFTCIVAGPTLCGKSTFVTRLLLHAAAMIDPPPENITWCYGEWQETYATTDLTHVRFKEGLPTEAMFDSTKRNLIVIDDLMTETDKRVTTLFTKNSHHRNTSVLYLVQNLFSNNKEHRTISLNTQYMVVFKNPRDTTSMSVPHGYLLIDLKQDTSEDMRLRSTCTYGRYKKIEHANRLFIRTMSALVKRNILCVQAMNRSKSAKLRRAIIANADADLLCALAECAYNMLKKYIPLTALQRRHLNK